MVPSQASNRKERLLESSKICLVQLGFDFIKKDVILVEVWTVSQHRSKGRFSGGVISSSVETVDGYLHSCSASYEDLGSCETSIWIPDPYYA